MMPLRPALLSLLLVGCAATNPRVHGDVKVYTFENGSNAHVVVQGQGMVLIDTGLDGKGEALEQNLRSAGLDPAAVKSIVLTHGHADHAGAAQYFHEHFGTPIIAGEGDRKMLESGKNEPLCPTGLIGKLRHTQDETAAYHPTTVSTWVTEPLALGPITGVEGTVTLLGGHTPGSLVVTVGELVFVGDLFRGSLVGSGAQTHLYMCDLEGNRRDVARLLHEIAPKGQTFYVGHFGEVTRASVQEHFEVQP